MATKPGAASSSGTLDKLSPLAKVAVGLLFVFLVGLLYFVVFYSEVDSQISAAERRQVQLESQLAQAEISKQEYQKDLEEKTRREQLARDQKKVLPDEAETPAFLASIQSVATISGVNLTSWSPMEEVPQQFFAKVPMKLTLSGKFHQVAKFFHSVGQIDRIINAENIQIKKPTIAGEDVTVEVECLATAFRALRLGEAPPTKRKGVGK